MKKETFSIIIVPHDLKKTRTIRVPYPLLYVCMALLAIGFVALVVFVATYGRLLVKARETGNLERQVAELTRRQEAISEIARNISKIRALDFQIREMLGVEIPPADSAGAENEALTESELNRELEDQKEYILRALPTFWPVRGYITRGFHIGGGKDDPQYHPGIDVGVDRGTPVRAAAPGYVVEEGWDDTYGFYLLLDHGYGIKTLYGHNDRLVVMRGERVGRGQTIAYAGTTGRSTAPHLHFEVIRDGINVDPLEYLLQ
jgi:murein DD-endopeptidase MepM/ murein hydrolase activator NlpD